jgi:hypothetical protein
MLWWLIVRTKNGIQEKDFHTGKYLLSIHHCHCGYGNFAYHVANRQGQRSVTWEVDDDILDVVNETLGIRT